MKLGEIHELIMVNCGRAYLMAQDRKFRAWTMRYPLVTVGCVRWSWRNLTVLVNRRALVALPTTWKQQ